MLPGEVLDAHGDLLERLCGVPDFRDLLGLFTAVDGHPPGTDSKVIIDSAPRFADLALRAVENAYTYRVSYDMCTLLEAAAMDLDDTDMWDLSLPPTEFGFVRFDKPLEFLDETERKMLVHFVVWGRGPDRTGRPSSIMWAFNDRYTEPDGSDEIAQLGAMAQSIEDGLHTVKSASKSIERVRLASGRWNPTAMARMSVGSDLGPPLIMVMNGDTEESECTNLARHMHALWLMLGQTITITTDEHPERHARKRAQKRGIPSKVTLIHLRRAVYPHREPGESMVEWSHRWPVRGHWAWRACSDKHPQAVHGAPVKGGIGVRIYIAPYIKGPDDKPLVMTEKVFSLER